MSDHVYNLKSEQLTLKQRWQWLERHAAYFKRLQWPDLTNLQLDQLVESMSTFLDKHRVPRTSAELKAMNRKIAGDKAIA